MPLSIIRNDITKVSADAIVNTANPHVAVGEGTDLAIYEAAGPAALLEERAKIGEMKPGQAAATPAFALDAKYIIHTVGPEWCGGEHGESETVRECYRNCLSEAVRLGCESIAFPLISTGTYGFPKDAALDIAVKEFTDFLDYNEMDITLVVYDRESFGLSSELFSDIRSYISDAEAKRKLIEDVDFDRWGGAAESSWIENREYRALKNAPVSGHRYAMSEPESDPKRSARKSRKARGLLRRLLEHEEDANKAEAPLYSERTEAAPMPSAPESIFPGEPLQDEMVLSESIDAAGSALFPYEESVKEEETVRSDATGAFYSKRDIDAGLLELLNNKEETFQQMLFRIIDRKGMSDPEVYKKANIDRKLFSKIRSNVNYNPTKKTAIAFAIALGLNLDETTDLLKRAGLSLSPSSNFDIIIRYCIEHGIYNIHRVNLILFEFDQMLLGA